MNNVPFKSFVNLVSLDQHIKSVEEKKIAHNVVLAGIEARRRLFLDSLENAHKKAKEARHQVNRHEQDMKNLDEQEQAKKKLLQQSSDYKLCQSLQKELNTIQSEQTNHEHLLLQAWSLLESAEQFALKVEKEQKPLEQELEQEFEQIKKEIHAVDALLQELQVKREGYLTDAIPQEWLDKYELMGARVQNPVVPIVQESCSGCYYQLTVQDVIRLRRGALLQCKRCFRLLYSEESMQ